MDGKELEACIAELGGPDISRTLEVVNCASDEFSTLLDRSRYNWVDVRFLRA